MSTMLDKFRLAKYEIDLICAGPLFLPPFKGSSLRGALTMQFKRLVCHTPNVKSCEGCEREFDCPYAYIFETPVSPQQTGAVGFSKYPRPFVIEPPLDDRQEYDAGDVLRMHLILFGKAVEYLPYFVVTLRELGTSGIGAGRAPFELGRIYAVNELSDQRAVVYNPSDSVVRATTITLGYEDAVRYASKLSKSEVTIKFLTCTRLMYRGRPAFNPEFHILIRNVLRRISLLSAGHCDQWPDLDYATLHAKAEKVEICGGKLDEVYWEHVSRRQGQRIPHEGVVGEVKYRGELAEFMPFLVLGMFTHVGDSPVFGMGRYEISV